MLHRLIIQTHKSREVVDLTDDVARYVPESDGILHVFVSHTTAAITTADLDPGTDLDLLDALHGMLPKQAWRHPHNPEHAPAHLLASIVGPSVAVPYNDGQLVLGTWQRVILLEFDGPKERTIIVTT